MKSRDLPLEKFDRDLYGVPMLRLGLGFRLFFPRPFKKTRTAVKTLWDKYLAWVGKDVFTWARLGGGNKSRKASESAFKTIDSWFSGKADYGPTCWISINDGPMDDLGAHTFFLEGRELNPSHEDVGYVHLVLPVTFLDSMAVDDLAAKFISLAADVPFFSGQAGFMLQHTVYRQNDCAPEMAALSDRYEGVEVSFSDRLQCVAGLGFTTVNWLTFVGEGFVEKLGGRSKLSRALPKQCGVTPLQHGLALRLSPTPLLGDRKKGKDELAVWRKVYMVLKPVQFLHPDLDFDPNHFDGKRTNAWLTRLER